MEKSKNNLNVNRIKLAVIGKIQSDKIQKIKK